MPPRCRTVHPGRSHGRERTHDARRSARARGAVRPRRARARRGAGGPRTSRDLRPAASRVRGAWLTRPAARGVGQAGRPAGAPAGPDHGRRGGSTLAVLPGGRAGQNTDLASEVTDASAAIVLRGLPPTTGSQVYEAWVIVGSNAPVPAGALAYSDGVGYLASNVRQVGAGATVAFTKEPGPGATQPTSPILSSGVLSSAPS